MKKLISAALIAAMSISLAGCGSSDNLDVEASTLVDGRAVNVQEISLESNPVTLDYIGTVSVKDTVKYAFKSGGRIETIYVEKGQEVKEGDPLVALNVSDLENQSAGAKAQLDAARAQYNKALNGASSEAISRAKSDVATAETAKSFAADQLFKVQTLYETGSASRQTLEEVEYNYTMASNTYDKAVEGLKELEGGARSEDISAAKAQLEAAGSQYAIVSDLVDDAVLYAVSDGVIMEVLNEESELVGQGYPVVVARSNSQVISVGVSQKDIDTMAIGDTALVKVNDTEAMGAITYIADVPDSATRTYNVEVTVDHAPFKLGAISEVSFDKGQEEGVWVPIKTLFSNGEDYVFVIKEGRSYKQIVTIESVTDTKVKVFGLAVGDVLVTDGMKYLDDGKQVSIVE